MGIGLNALVIALGGVFGSRLHQKTRRDDFRMLGICIILVSFVGFFENIYRVSNGKLISEDLMLILLSFFLGSKIGEWLRLDERIQAVGTVGSASRNAVLNGFLYFGIGGLQICGPLALATRGDNSQLILKSIIDIPFAIIFGAAYGKSVSLAAIPVALVQLALFVAARALDFFFTDGVIMQFCAMGYVILFFTGYNLIADAGNKISNANMLPGILLMLLIGGVKEWVF